VLAQQKLLRQVEVAEPDQRTAFVEHEPGPLVHGRSAPVQEVLDPCAEAEDEVPVALLDAVSSLTTAPGFG
jgi:hypothetical protein